MSLNCLVKKSSGSSSKESTVSAGFINDLNCCSIKSHLGYQLLWLSNDKKRKLNNKLFGVVEEFGAIVAQVIDLKPQSLWVLLPMKLELKASSCSLDN
ncbi:hypothetical protein BpHYR1_009913 [Brachionus plicatilis]|uniref:Uncharacterized protein n=1 Tax=Brachionus plicatilis TaxID=10195 RepID=A0A3M7REY3_BRAPC|nr:hypothetical protein BpHYR1_009913 [Brachionus plicatilis]